MAINKITHGRGISYQMTIRVDGRLVRKRTPDLTSLRCVTSTKTITKGVGVKARSRVEMFERIRRDHRDDPWPN